MKEKEFYQININKKSKTFIPVRNYGIDLLKIIAMINIINLHINLRGNYLSLNSMHPKYKQIYRLEAFSFWPVDAFGLISGIVGFKKYKFSNLIFLYCEYYFYSVISFFYLYFKSLTSLKLVFYRFFPIGIKYHWYVNAYFYMYLFLPFINKSINSMDKKYFTKLFYFFLFIYSFYHTITKVTLKSNTFDFTFEGYSSLWLFILYLLGAYLGRFHINKHSFSNFYFFLIYLISSFITSEYIFFTGSKIFMAYLSPTIIMQALSLIFFFSNMKIRNIYLQKVILFFNPLNFNVTLIHSRIMIDFFSFIKSLTPKLLFFKIYGLSILIYLVCSFIDYFRFLIFKLFKIRDLCIYIEQKFI